MVHLSWLWNHPASKQTYQGVPRTRIEALPSHCDSFRDALATCFVVKSEFSPIASDLLLPSSNKGFQIVETIVH